MLNCSIIHVVLKSRGRVMPPRQHLWDSRVDFMPPHVNEGIRTGIPRVPPRYAAAIRVLGKVGRLTGAAARKGPFLTFPNRWLAVNHLHILLSQDIPPHRAPAHPRHLLSLGWGHGL